jgi:hypothetical protein
LTTIHAPVPADLRVGCCRRAATCLTIEREPKRSIEVERRAVVPGLPPRLLTQGHASAVELRNERDRYGRIETCGFESNMRTRFRKPMLSSA